MNQAIPFVLTAALVAGCAAGPAKGPTATRSWRSGTVVATGLAADIGPIVDEDCRTIRPNEGDGSRRYAKVRYRAGRHFYVSVVPIPDGSTVETGDVVDISWSSQCVDVLRPAVAK